MNDCVCMYVCRAFIGFFLTISLSISHNKKPIAHSAHVALHVSVLFICLSVCRDNFFIFFIFKFNSISWCISLYSNNIVKRGSGPIRKYCKRLHLLNLRFITRDLPKGPLKICTNHFYNRREFDQNRSQQKQISSIRNFDKPNQSMKCK